MTKALSTSFNSSPVSNNERNTQQHDEVTLQLAKKESQQHFHGMEELQSMIQNKPLQIQAFKLMDGDDTTSTSKNVKIVHFVRHGQGFHNLLADIYASQGKEWVQFTHDIENNPYVKPELLDAPLTDKGRQQAKALQPKLSSMQNQTNSLELIVLSTNCRALQTGVIAFESYIGQIPFLAHELIREETGVHICDSRRKKTEQMNEFPMVDFGLVESEEDDLFRTDRRENKIEIGSRIYEFMEWLELRDETHIGIASHSGWLFTLFNGVFECEDDLKAWFQTGEMRSVKLVFTRDSCTSTSPQNEDEINYNHQS